MSRAKIPKGKQREFLNRVQRTTNFGWDIIAKLSNVCQRSLRDWRREKNNMSYEALLKLHKISGIPIPENIQILPEHWSTKIASRSGAKRRYELYGNPGTPEGRRKGGLNSQRKFRFNPEYAKRIGVKIRKEIRHPNPSSLLAEFIGIMLGDGGMSNYQVCITFNRETDKTYSIFLQRVIKELFFVSSSIISTDSDKGDNIVISAKNLVEFLEEKGLKRGNKVRNKVEIPDWIWRKRNFQISCLRGLMDTDGSFYTYRHKVYDRIYYNSALCLTNYSKPLLNSIGKILTKLGFNPVLSKNRIYLHRKKEIDRYFKEVGSNNPKHLSKYEVYFKERYRSPVITGRSRKAVGA